ncbi:MAG TPA: YggS family pyridoxal phosphate-dependent enzyme [Saprospiraceae bacterium]|nr:YggS family pyridoxal phosphate-dependent enzyme [Saprospiraceae bacterium]
MKKYLEVLAEAKKYGARLIVVSKLQAIDKIKSLYDLGCRDFAENRVQDLLERKAALPEDIRWHLIGHLQTNKVKSIVTFIYLVQSVDSVALLKVIDTQASKADKFVDVLLEVKIASEQTKFGFSKEELFTFLESADYKKFHNVRICGLMGMATFTEDAKIIRSEFKLLKSIFEEVKRMHIFPDDQFVDLSIGMSSDYTIALEEGSSMLRVGTLVFSDL